MPLATDSSVERYIGSGKLYFTPEGGSQVEIGEVEDVSFSISVEYAEALSGGKVLKRLSEKVATKITSKVSFKTKNLNKENLALSYMGEVTTENFNVGDELPDGTTATVATTVDVIKGGTRSSINGELKFVADVPAGKKRPVLLIYSAAIMPSADIALVANEFASLNFEGDVYDTANGFFKEYLMVSA